jgi:hypothetical protein
MTTARGSGASKYWFNVENFERDPARSPTSFQTRAFPFQITF